MSSPPERRRVRGAVGLLPVLLALTACAGGGDTVRTAPSAAPSATPAPSPAPSPALSSAGPSSLVLEGSAGPGASPVRATLTCEPAGGDHPEPEQACADLSRTPAPFAPLPADSACTEQYGGPQTAVVRGTWRGAPVELQLSRTDGCRIAQWDRLGALLSAVLPTGG